MAGWFKQAKIRITAKGLLWLFSPFLFISCAHVYTSRGAWYRVHEGETLANIAEIHRVDVQELAEVNNIQDPESVKAGQSVFIPGVTPSGLAHLLEQEKAEQEKVEHKPAKPPLDPTSRNEKLAGRRPIRHEPSQKKDEVKEASIAEPVTRKPTIKLEKDKFIWPVQGDISSPFGMRHGRRHDGIDIRAKQGTPIIAAADGEVVFAKKMRGYGNLVLVQHDDDFYTVYAHNSVNLVKKGAKVEKGQLIAKVGRTGRATGSHLHFEVRTGAKARNPLFFLPENRYASPPGEERGEAYGGSEEENP